MSPKPQNTDPFSDLVRLFRDFDRTSFIRFGEEINRAGDAIRRIVEAVELHVSPFVEKLREHAPVIALLLDRVDLFNAVDKAEWLPHSTSPVALVEGARNDPAELDRLLGEYYTDNWDEVAAMLVQRVEGYDINEESKDTFKEAVASHGYGHYRSAVRLLLPEIERLVRIETGARVDETITSQHDLQSAASVLTNRHIDRTGIQGGQLLKRLTSHLYVHVKTDADLERFRNHGVPNRHAAIHGLIAYGSCKHSLNTIFMMDYVMLIIDLAKQEETAAAAA